MATQPEVLDNVLAWEQRLSPMVLALDPVTPSELIWRRIYRDINLPDLKEKQPSVIQQRPFWHSAAVIVLTIGLAITSAGWWRTASQPAETVVKTEVETVIKIQPEVATISVITAKEKTLWVARLYPQSARLDINVQSLPAAQPNKDYQLWTLQDNGIPVSLGLLPKLGRASLTLDDNTLDALSRSEMLAVSLEPLGGSPEAVPTGPVLFTSALLAPQG